MLNAISRITVHAFKLFNTHSTGVSGTFFCERVVNLWNNLPSNTDFSSFFAFKRSISNIDLWTSWNVTDFLVFVLFLNVHFTELLLLNYRVYCRGTFWAWLLLLYSLLKMFSCDAAFLKQINLIIKSTLAISSVAVYSCTFSQPGVTRNNMGPNIVWASPF